MPPDDRLDRWIDELRDRLAGGHLASLPPFDLGYGTGQLLGELTVRVMLHDLTDLNDPNGSAAHDPARRQARLAGLRDDFRRLRELLG